MLSILGLQGVRSCIATVHFYFYCIDLDFSDKCLEGTINGSFRYKDCKYLKGFSLFKNRLLRRAGSDYHIKRTHDPMFNFNSVKKCACLMRPRIKPFILFEIPLNMPFSIFYIQMIPHYDVLSF